jgi:FkbM family methyltransferase
MKYKIKRLLPNVLLRLLISIKKRWMDGFARKSYSQEGEDLVLMRLLKGKSHGFYVDVGAHHPYRFSNTYFFYKKGWRGINIDAMPGSMKLFNTKRPRDINIEIPISSKEETLTYYQFNEPALNGFSKEISESRDASKKYNIIEKKLIKTETLNSVLEKYLPTDQEIDFLSIDVEGLDFEVLRSIELKKYKPSFIIIEDLGFSLLDLNASKIYCHLLEQGYVIVAKCFNSLIFQKDV